MAQISVLDVVCAFLDENGYTILNVLDVAAAYPNRDDARRSMGGGVYWFGVPDTNRPACLSEVFVLCKHRIFDMLLNIDSDGSVSLRLNFLSNDDLYVGPPAENKFNLSDPESLKLFRTYL